MESLWLTGKYNKMLEEIEKIEGRLGEKGRIDPHRKISQILDIMDSAKYSIDIVGINATGPVHQGKEALTKVLKNGGTVRISVLDYRKEDFDEREKKEKDKYGRLISELGTTFAILHEIHDNNRFADLRIYFHRFPNAALTIGDMDKEEGQMQVNVYPKADGVRGLKGRTFLLKPEDGDAFKAGRDFYLALVDDSDITYYPDIPDHRSLMNAEEKMIIRKYLKI